MNDQRLNEISRNLEKILQRFDSVIRVGVTGLSQGKSQSEQIWLLSRAGLQPKEIADFVDTTPNTVRVVLSNLRKSRRSKQRSGGLK